jgi:hypothetical protein
MNQKSLVITIVAVVAIVVVIGLWLSGALQTGSLSGDIALKTTTLTLNVWVINPEGALGDRLIGFSGTLRDSSGNPLPGRTVAIRTGSVTVETVTTGTDGSYSAQHGEWSRSAYSSIFAGDSLHQGSVSPLVWSPA